MLGDKAVFSEVDGDNNIVLAGTYTNTPNTQATAMNYRAFSFDWQSTPNNTIPVVYSYAVNQTAPTAIHVSWNGATTVSTWRFYASDNIGDGFAVIGSTGHAGFETMWSAPQYHPWIMVEAVAWDGTSLANSSYQGTYVPSPTVAAYCNDFACAAATAYSSSS